jgi:ATP-dependent helicase HrpA
MDDPATAAAAHRQGVMRLYALQLRTQLQALEKGFKTLAPLQMKAMTIPGLKDMEPLATQILAAALARVCLGDPLPRDREAFVKRRDEARGRLGLIAQEIARLVGIIIDESLAMRRKLDVLKAGDPARVDIEQHLQRLLGKRFVRDVPAEALAHYPRYLKAIGLRIDKAKTEPMRDALRLKDVTTLQTPWLREVAARRGQQDPRLEEFRWLLEELRVSLFAQELRTPYPVSVKRLEKFWQGVKS